MRHSFRITVSTLAVLALAACAQSGAETMSGSAMAPAPSSVVVGGQPMLPSQTIVANAVNSADHTTLVAAVEAAGLVGMLQGPGPFTVFAPTNAAFDELSPGTVESLLRPENKQSLTEILTYHVVPGRLDADALVAMIEANGGEARLRTASGETLAVRLNGPSNVVIVDANGQVADIATYDVGQSNGVIHVVDTVLLPG